MKRSVSMDFGIYSYLVTTLIFAAGAVAIEWVLGFRILFRRRRLIGVVMGIGVLATVLGEPIALRWRIWTYNAERTFNVLVLGAELETYIYALLVALAVASATVAWARYEEQGMPLIKTTWIKLIEKFAEWRGVAPVEKLGTRGRAKGKATE